MEKGEFFLLYFPRFVHKSVGWSWGGKCVMMGKICRIRKVIANANKIIGLMYFGGVQIGAARGCLWYFCGDLVKETERERKQEGTMPSKELRHVRE